MIRTPLGFSRTLGITIGPTNEQILNFRGFPCENRENLSRFLIVSENKLYEFFQRKSLVFHQCNVLISENF